MPHAAVSDLDQHYLLTSLLGVRWVKYTCISFHCLLAISEKMKSLDDFTNIFLFPNSFLTYLKSHTFQVNYTVLWEVAEPVHGISKLFDLIISHSERCHDLPLIFCVTSLCLQFTLKIRISHFLVWRLMGQSTNMVKLSQSVYLTTLFLGRFSPLSISPVRVCIL